MQYNAFGRYYLYQKRIRIYNFFQLQIGFDEIKAGHDMNFVLMSGRTFLAVRPSHSPIFN